MIWEQSESLCIDFSLSGQMEKHHSQMTLTPHAQTTEAKLLAMLKTWLISLWFMYLFFAPLNSKNMNLSLQWGVMLL